MDIELRRTQCPVLVYAKGALFEELSKIDGAKKVIDASDEELRNMNERKKGNVNHAVYVANDEYGMRGTDYRAEMPSNGIALFMAAPFGDVRERLQGLLRVGRRGDKCCRIQDTSVKEIDDNISITRKRKMYAAMEEVVKSVQKI